ncbi:MAG: hypothetical protein JW798_05195 [Prolixibacteraceae bacterium]|nr:hypothetical protein [Prolixibacteraceae bacterium]
MTNEQIISYLNKPEQLDESTLGELHEAIGHYPYFPVLRMLYLKNLLNIKSYKFETELAGHAIFIPDRRVLYSFLNRKPGDNKEFELLPYDKEAFARFFELSSGTATGGVPFDMPSDYGLNEVDTSKTKEDVDLIDRFISKNPTISHTNDKVEIEKAEESFKSDSLDDGLITETLATIYVKQEMYEEAIRSYKKLSLKFPEKNTYFAAQIEKIKELMSKKD